MEKYMAAADQSARAAIATPLRVKPTLEKFLAHPRGGRQVKTFYS